MSLSEDDVESTHSARFLLPGGGDTGDIERYERGGFHPVHLGDRYDGAGYKITHKLGAGGFSTVWLAQDLMQKEWVGLKIVLADETPTVESQDTPGPPCSYAVR